MLALQSLRIADLFQILDSVDRVALSNWCNRNLVVKKLFQEVYCCLICYSGVRVQVFQQLSTWRSFFIINSLINFNLSITLGVLLYFFVLVYQIYCTKYIKVNYQHKKQRELY